MTVTIDIDLENLLDLVHDRFFELSQCVYREDEEEFLLFFGDEGDSTFNRNTMRVTNVSRVGIRDEARVDTYDINKVAISPSTVRIVSAFPVEITLTIGSSGKIHISRTKE